MKNLSFWAQSLDNQSPDIIFKDGEELSDDKLRQKLVSEIYEIPKNNIEVLSADSAVTVRYSYPKFVIEAIPTEKDQVNRLAPIVIYGILPDNLSEIWIKEVCTGIEDFVSSRLKRTLDNSALVAIHDWLSEILEKKKKAKLQYNGLGSITSYFPRLVSWLRIMLGKLFRIF
jgi:hypothetical protein